MQLFGSVGLVTKLCLTGDTMHTSRFAFIEFSRTEEAHVSSKTAKSMSLRLDNMPEGIQQ